jgi:hypothetical protein
MTNSKLIQLDRISQLLIFQLKTVHEHMDQAWIELELARSDLRDLMEVHEEWEEENDHFKKGWELH